MLVKDIMTTGVDIIDESTTLQQAAEEMKKHNIGALPVSSQNEVTGIVTDRDIVTRAVAENKDPRQTKVSEVMSRDLEWCSEDQTVNDVADIMKQRQIRRMPVMNADRKLVGILSLGDVAVRGDMKLAGETMERVSEPSRPVR
jgi:CBS domain-containing protein